MKKRVSILMVTVIISASAAVLKLPGIAGAVPTKVQGAEMQESDFPLPPWSNSFDVATGAGGIAMGGAVSANPYLKSSFRFNPAVLAESEGLEGYFSFRPSNVGMYESDYYSIGLAMETSVAVFALDYSRHVSDQHGLFAYPELSYTEGESFDYTVTASASRYLYRGFSAGVNLKYYERGVNYLSFNLSDIESDGAWAMDAGLLYRWRGIVRSESARDHLRLALAVRNLGTSFEYIGMNFDLPIILRAGISYQLSQGTRWGREFVRFILAGEYRRWMNDDGKYEDKTDYFNYGMEALFLETFSLRFGGMVTPEYGIYGKADHVNFFGAGLEMSLQRFSSAGVPLSVSIDYAYVPSVDSNYFFDDDNSANVFTIAISYNNQIF